jgi:hypothetical protein
MLAVFSGAVVGVPAELVAAGSRTPSPKTRASELVTRFLGGADPAVSMHLGDLGSIAYSHANQALLRPRYGVIHSVSSFAREGYVRFDRVDCLSL